MFNKTKKLLVLGAFFTLCSTAHAELIELDTQSPDHCRQQVLNAPDEMPVILAYFDGCEPAKKFIENVYEPIAKEHPERTFFKYNMDSNSSDWQTYSQCLQLAGHIGSPTAMLYYKAVDPTTGNKILFGPLRAGGGGDTTKEEFLKLIEPDNAKKSISFSKNLK